AFARRVGVGGLLAASPAPGEGGGLAGQGGGIWNGGGGGGGGRGGGELKLIASLRSKTHDAAAFAWKHHPDANQVLAVATIILVVLAYMALKDTEDTLELSERAWVGPADAKIDAVPQEGKEVKATVSVR